MSDTMLFGVLRMPYELAMSSELSRLQFHDRAQQACDTIEALQAKVERLTLECEVHTAENRTLRNIAVAQADTMDAMRADAERLREFDAWLDDRAGPLLHIDDVRAARTGSKT